MRKLFKITLFTILLISSILGGGIVTMRLESHNREYQKIKRVDKIVIMRLENLKEHNTLLKRKEIIKNILK
jgi:hypothetical protein|tara:strand:+ start:1063 stop:1275 length:213 start_codon:yes stop_codon:yes gene_type:complete